MISAKAPDANDIMREHGADGLRNCIAKNGRLFKSNGLHDAAGLEWSEPKPLPNGLEPVPPFDLEFLPECIAPWIGDISDRMQCPRDLVAIPAMAALGSVLGCKIGIRPQRQTTWLEVPNIWGAVVARPGAMKSPAMEEALKPLKRLEIGARKQHAVARNAYEGEREIFEIKRSAAKTKVKKEGADATMLLEIEKPEEPKAKRYTTNDTTYEKLGEILAENCSGILVVRDELVSLLRTLDRDENASARGLYQSGWNGTSGYSFDRIIRGTTHIDRVCISVLGTAQPGTLAEFVRQAVAGGSGDDGLIQRFGLLVWPDQGAEWRNVDRWPDSAARDTAWSAFQYLDQLTPDRVGAQHDEFEGLRFLRFDDAAYDVFLGWRTDLEANLRSSELHPALASHFSKYRKMIPALALINHLADRGIAAIGEPAVQKAIAFAGYLAAHARRVYGAGMEGETAVAKAILHRIRKRDLQDRFTARDIYRAQWSNLSDRNQVQAGLDLLVDLDWIASESILGKGRTKILYHINPRAFA